MLIKVTLEGTTYWDKGVPCVSGGYQSEMDDSELEKITSVIDNENEKTEVTEYWLNGELVHRSVNMHLKKGIYASGKIGVFS